MYEAVPQSLICQYAVEDSNFAISSQFDKLSMTPKISFNSTPLIRIIIFMKYHL